MKWTTKPPSEIGFWWYRLKPGAEHFPLRLKLGEGGKIITGTGKQVETMQGEWGDERIPEPT